MKTQSVIVAAVVTLTLPLHSPAQSLERRIQSVMDRPEFAHSSWGIDFYDLGTGKSIYSVNRERLFVPGSTTKLLTMGTAFEYLGADHRFRTRVYRTGPVRDGILDGNLVLVAAGDPNLSGREQPDGSYSFVDLDHSYGGLPVKGDPLGTMRDLARQVAERGITTVLGEVLVDASLFPEGERDGGTGVPLGPLVINDNLIDIVVRPGARAGLPATVTVSPQTSYLTVFANLTTVDSGQSASIRMVEDSSNLDHRTLVVSGTVPRGLASNPRWIVPSPSRFGEIVFSELLNEAGVRAIPRLRSRHLDPKVLSRWYADSSLVAEHVSLPLAAEAMVLLKTSQNLHASNFPLLLGSLPAARDSGHTGFDLERSWLMREGLDTEGAMQGDGAGARAFYSPAFMTRFLEAVARKPYARAFQEALPILGRDGTLALVQVNSPAAGKVHAKTGTYSIYDPLHRRTLVTGKGLAGYFTSRSGRSVAFALYVNNFAADVPDPAGFAGQALGEIASIAWEWMR